MVCAGQEGNRRVNLEEESPLVSSIYTSKVKAHLSLPTSPGEVSPAGRRWLQPPFGSTSSPAAHSPAWWAGRGLVRRGGKALGKDWARDTLLLSQARYPVFLRHSNNQRLGILDHFWLWSVFMNIFPLFLPASEPRDTGTDSRNKISLPLMPRILLKPHLDCCLL